MTASPRSLPLVAIVLVIAVVGVNARLVVGGKTWADLAYHTEVAPPRLAAADSVQAGALPQWWDGTGLGVPLAAEPSHGALYPPTWIAATPQALDLLAIVHLAWAALGVAVWARRRIAKRGLVGPDGPELVALASEPAAVVAGLLVATTGILASTAVRGALPAIAHLPWLGLAAATLADAHDRRERVRATIAIGVLLGLVGLSGVFAGLVDALVVVIALAARRRHAGYLVAAIGGGLAIGAAQWLPALLALGDGAGGNVHGLPLARLVELVVPGSFGALEPEHAIGTISGDVPWAPSLFVGAPLLALAAVRTPSRRLLGVIGAFATLALVVGRGGWPGWLGAPELHVAALVVVLGGAQAASGVDALVAGERRAVIVLGVGGACAGIALGALGVLRSQHPDAGSAIDRALLEGGFGLVCIAVVVALAARGARRAMPVALALLVLPTVGSTPSLAPVIDRAIVDTPSPWAEAALRSRRDAAPLRVYRSERMFDSGARRPATLLDARATAPVLASEGIDDAVATLEKASAWKWGIAAARSDDPARPAVHDQVWLAAAREGGALLDRFGISLSILPDSVAASLKVPALGHRSRWTLVELPVAPAASVMRGWSWAVAPEDALALTYPGGGGTGILRGTTVLRGGGPSQVDRGPPLPCTIDRWTSGDIELACTTDQAGYAVVSSTAAPGWNVTIDDRDAEWLTADVMRRAVAVAPGTHRVHWHYDAPGFGIGLALAGVGLALLVALGLASMRPRS